MATNFLNETRNQHYLSQVEQRLNTSTPWASTKNQRIFEFEILDRFENAQLGAPTNQRIRNSLALEDVFSFDVVPGGNLRHNFETLFHQYEQSLVKYTNAVIAKAEANARPDEMRPDLMGLFATKLLNFARNPFSVPKALDTFKSFIGFRPTDPALNELLDLVLAGSRPHQAETCKRLNLSEQQYQQWLGVLFMMLTSFEQPSRKENFLDGLVEALFNTKATVVAVQIFRYSKDKCLLSDRSFISSIPQEGMDCIEFNLRHDSFIRFAFASRPALFHPDYAVVMEHMKPTLFVDYRLDDCDSLALYNRDVINQSHSKVLCCVDNGIIVAKPPLDCEPRSDDALRPLTTHAT